jgi:hypothetical protein
LAFDRWFAQARVHSIQADSCLFLQNDCIFVAYVDDCLIFAGKEDVINKLIADLSKNFLLQDEGDVNAFIGVQIHKDPGSKTITLSQPSLIQQVIRDVGITHQNNGKLLWLIPFCMQILQTQTELKNGIIGQ